MEPTASRGGEVDGLDSEFLNHLQQGSTLLARGELDAAHSALECAAELRPDDPQVLGLLGQTCYRQGRFDEAAAAYARLVDETPREVAPRVNLGLASLKARAWRDAVRHLRTALDLAPGHARAMNYLGLAYLELGEVEEARGWFARAGSEHMVARCDALLAPPPAEPEASPPPAAEPAVPAAAADDAGAAPAAHPAPDDLASAVQRAPGAAAPLAAEDDFEVSIDEAGPEQLAPARAPQADCPPVARFAAERPLALPPGEPFGLAPDAVAVHVRGEVLARADGLAAVLGEVALSPEVKRFRGKTTDHPFGEGERRVFRARGEGALLYRAGDRAFTALELAGEAAYFREDAVFAIEGQVLFENGRLQSRYEPALHLVHLRGEGRFLLATDAPPAGVEVTPAAPLHVRPSALVGWIGALTPRVVPLGGEDGAEPLVVELTGEGRVLLAPPAGGRA